MHWIDQKVQKIIERPEPQTIASGISISGHIHIGHSKDVFIADAVARALRDEGVDAKAVWYADDIDPMRRIPWPLEEEDYEEHLGKPYSNIPAPGDEYDSFVDFFANPFLEALPDFGIEAEILHSSEFYDEGRLNEEIRLALENKNLIKDILDKYRSDSLSEDWLPYDPICQNCGRIATTEAYDWEGNYVYYDCEGVEYVDGCGYEGKADFTKGEGKLTWRVEWPARWRRLDVTCEPFGKDHAADGGSYDTGKEIARKVFDIEPPEPIPYEWISLRGEPMSSSKGRVFTLKEWLEVAEPELLRYFIFGSKAMKAKDFDPRNPLLQLYQQFRKVEGVYFDVEEDVPESRRDQMKRIYELSMTGDVSDNYPQRIPIRLATIMVQVASDKEHVINILKRKGVLENPGGWEVELAMERLEKAENWVDKYAPESEKLEVLDEPPEGDEEKLYANQKEALSKLAKEIDNNDYGPVEIHNRVFELSETFDLEPVEVFQSIYISLIGEKHGPRAGNFLTALDDDFVVRRFEKVANS